MTAKVFAIDPEIQIQIGSYGYATAAQPATVPEEVGREMEADKRLRVEWPEAKAAKVPEKPAAVISKPPKETKNAPTGEEKE